MGLGEAEIGILAKALSRHLHAQIAVGGRDDADVHPNRTLAAHATDFPLLEHAEQLRLELQGQLTDFVQEKRAPLRLLEDALVGDLGAREGSPLVPEELGLDQTRRDRAAIEDDEGLPSSTALVVDRFCNHVLAGTGFSLEQKSVLGGSDPLELGEELPHPWGRTNRAAKAIGIGLLAFLRLSQRSDGDHAVSETDGKFARNHGVVDTRAAELDAIGRAGIPNANPRRGGFELAVVARHRLVGEHQIVVRCGANAQKASGDIESRSRIRTPGHDHTHFLIGNAAGGRADSGAPDLPRSKRILQAFSAESLVAVRVVVVRQARATRRFGADRRRSRRVSGWSRFGMLRGGER